MSCNLTGYPDRRSGQSMTVQRLYHSLTAFAREEISMKLWYKAHELPAAREEAQKAVEQMNAEIPHYINGDVKIRMAWREDELVENDVAGRCYIPEAELLVNGETARRELLDFILLDLNALILKTMTKNWRK